MIPRLFEKNETTFANYGICPLVDSISCHVTEVRNGEYTLELTYPRGGRFADEISVDRIILADPFDNSSQAEPFRISEVEFDMNDNISVKAEHISYQLNHVIIAPLSKNTRYPATAWARCDEVAMNTNPFTFYTDMTDSSQTVYTYGCDVPTPLRTMLGGMEGSFLDLFGGEFKWERYVVNQLNARGADNGVKIAYTKNLTGLTYDIDISELYTGAVAYYSSGGTYVSGTVQTVANSYAFNRVKVLDATSDYGSTPTSAQLNTYASTWLSNNGNSPSVSVDVEFVPLWQTEEYKQFYGLEHVSLCDTVEVVYPPLDIDVKAKVVKTVYDVLRDRYSEITISTVKATLADTIFNLMEAVDG